MTEPLRVLDCSAFQGVIDWDAVKAAGVSGAIAKCCEGVGTIDPQFSRNWPEIARVGLVRGAYAFGRPDLGNAPEAEATFFLGAIGTVHPGDVLCLDLEVGNGDLSAWALAWLRHVAQAVGFTPLLYSFPSFIQAHLRDAALAAYPLWLAAYGPPTAMPSCPPPWETYPLWQWTDASAVPGVPDACDESLIYRDLAGLRALGKPAPAEKPALAEKAAEKASPPPVTHRVRMATTQWLRQLPRADSARLVECTAGEVFGVIGPPTTHWTHVTAHGQRGWLLSSNVERVD